MSFDLIVFDIKSATRNRSDFDGWVETRLKWEEAHGYNDPSVTTSSLKSWFDEMRKSFPPMNGPLAVDDEDEEFIADYNIGKDMIYVTFGWSAALIAYNEALRISVKHNVGFFNISDDQDGPIFHITGSIA